MPRLHARSRLYEFGVYFWIFGERAFEAPPPPPPLVPGTPKKPRRNKVKVFYEYFSCLFLSIFSLSFVDAIEHKVESSCICFKLHSSGFSFFQLGFQFYHFHTCCSCETCHHLPVVLMKGLRFFLQIFNFTITKFYGFFKLRVFLQQPLDIFL